MSVAVAEDRSSLDAGTSVEVRCTFDDEWIPGFEVLALEERGYRVLRRYDLQVIPDPIAESRVRPT